MKLVHNKVSRAPLTGRKWRFLCIIIPACVASPFIAGDALGQEANVKQALNQVRLHAFHTFTEDQSFTLDRAFGQHGVADLRDPDGRVRLLAVRDLVIAGTDATPQMIEGLRDENLHVRQVSAAALGILRAQEATESLESAAQDDPNPLVRTQAVISLGEIAPRRALTLLRSLKRDDPSRDVRLQCELAIDRIEKGMGATVELREAYHQLDQERFASVRVGEPAPDFTLPDTEGNLWTLGDFKGKKWTVLIWIFAEWCPVCHGEFRELIELRGQFEQAGVQIMTVECHDLYRCRVMAGKEVEPHYWFAKQPFKELYTQGIWWPHLVDRAGAVGAIYGVEPLAFAVHSEYVNRPSTIIVDPSGTVRFAYYGTFWGDRPTIQQTLQMIKQVRFEFEHPQRLKHVAEDAAGLSQ